MTPRIKRIRLSCPPSKSKSLGTATSPRSDQMLGARSCSVKVTDLLSETVNKVVRLESEVKNLRALQAQYEPIARDLTALAYLINAPVKPDLNLAMGAGKLFNTIATEVSKRIRCCKNAIVFNVPDKMDVNYIRYKFLNACGLNPQAGECVRLRKKQQKYFCPLLFKFSSESDADKFISSQSLIQEFTQFKRIRIIRDRTPLERAFAGNSASPISTGTPRSNHEVLVPVPDVDAVSQLTSFSSATVPQPTNLHAQLGSTEPLVGSPKVMHVTPVDLDISSSTTVSSTKKSLKWSPPTQVPKCKTTKHNSSPANSSSGTRKHVALSAPNSPRQANFRAHTYSYGAGPSLGHYTYHPARQTFPEPLTYMHAGGAACNVATSRLALYTPSNATQPPPLMYRPEAPLGNWQNPALFSRINPGFFDGPGILYPPPSLSQPPPFLNQEYFPPGALCLPKYTYPAHQFHLPPIKSPVPHFYPDLSRARAPN